MQLICVSRGPLALKIKYETKQVAEHLRQAFPVVISVIAMKILTFSHDFLPPSESGQLN